MYKLKYAELVDVLVRAGVAKSGVVHVQSDLRRIGPVEHGKARESILAFYLTAFQEVLGPQGTLTVCTGYADYGRYGTPFVVEESPSLIDAFSEYVRTRPGAVRSVHPIMSVTALGARAEELCGGAHYEGLSYDSPWGRLHRANALIMTLGLGTDQGGTTFFHYLEALYGVPYKYTKLFTAPVFSAGQQMQGPFTLGVRYLDYGIANTPVRMKRHLVDADKARELPVGRGRLWCCPAQDIIDEGIECLRRDRYFLLEKAPRFRQGELPMDGPTGAPQLRYD